MPLQFCTTSSRRYLPFARGLATSIMASYPAARLWVLLTDDHHHAVDTSLESFDGVWNDELELSREELHRMFLIHAGTFHIAIKPWIVEHVLNKTGGPVMFIDSDIRLYGALEDVATMIDEHGVAITPHVRAPFPLDGLMPDDTVVLGAGVYNAGMVGVGAKGRGFLEFWKSRLRRECYVDITKMRVGEQKWLDFVPSIGDCAIVRDPGVNAAYWNLHERPLSRDASGTIFAGEAPLRAFHFSGHDLDRPELISRHMVERARFRFEDQPILAELCAAYRADILAHGYHEAEQLSVDFSELPGGIPITPELSERFRLWVIAAEGAGAPYPPDPYDLEAREAFLAWARDAFAAAGLATPQWAALPAPPSRASALVRELAVSSSQAFANLDARLRGLEEQLLK